MFPGQEEERTNRPLFGLFCKSLKYLNTERMLGFLVLPLVLHLLQLEHTL